jgi:hypothetical protein
LFFWKKRLIFLKKPFFHRKIACFLLKRCFFSFWKPVCSPLKCYFFLKNRLSFWKIYMISWNVTQSLKFSEIVCMYLVTKLA